MPQLEFQDYLPQIVWLFITFVSLYVLMARLALPRVADILEERQNRIADDLGQAEKLRDESDAALESYEGALSEARARAHAIAQETRAEVQQTADAEKAELIAALTREGEEADARIRATKTEAMAGLQDIASGAAVEIVQQIAGLQISDADARDAVAVAGGA